ncbi:MAG: molybdopterin converting factor subunit 1 [Planctomycetota bacterium]|nr:molybdopterin converting factor subunit 1 [Planctomycetota bacterium]
MEIKVLVFARLRELFGEDEVTLSLVDGATVQDVLNAMIEAQPSLKDSQRALHVAVNQDIAEPDQVVKEADEIALFPPVGGG